MAVDSIQTVKVNAPQFKAAENTAATPAAPAPETKKDGNALLYGSLGALGVLAVGGLAYKALKGGKVDINNIKKLGYKFENGKMLNKKGKAYTGIVNKETANGTKIVQEYKNGVQVKTTIKPKDGEYKEIVRTTEKADGVLKNTTVYKPAKKDADYKEITKVAERTPEKVKTTTTKTMKKGEPVVETKEVPIKKDGGNNGGGAEKGEA